MLNSLFKYTFMQNAFLCSILISIACGIVGTIIIHKKLVMLSGGIAHTSFGGVGLGYFLGIEPIIGAYIFAVTAALGIGFISKKSKQSSDVATGIFWAAGMAVGILFITFTPGYPPDMNSYLFGDILTVTRLDLFMALILDISVLLLVILFYNCLQTYLFDEEFASVLRIKTRLINSLVFIGVALTIVVLIRAVGIILALALLIAPPAIAGLFNNNLKTIMLLSVLISIISCFIGLWLSYNFHVASGASIVLFLSFLYAISHVFRKFFAKYFCSTD